MELIHICERDISNQSTMFIRLKISVKTKKLPDC